MSDIKITITISKVKLAAILLLAVLGIGGLCYGLIISHQQVLNQVIVIPASTIVFTYDNGTKLETIDWGELAKGLSRDTDSFLGWLKLINIGSTDSYWCWNCSLPIGVTLSLYKRTGEQLEVNRYRMIPTGVYWEITLRLTVSNAAVLGPQNFTLNIWNADSESG